MRIISIANQKGGCGKTTTAINLSACLAINGRKALIIDLDPQGHSTMGLNIDTNNLDKTIHDALGDSEGEKIALEDVVLQVAENLGIAPANIGLSTFEQHLSMVKGRETRLKEAIDGFYQVYDYIIIDCPPSLGLLTFNSLMASTEVFIPIEMGLFSLHGTGRLMEIIDLVRNKTEHEIRVKVIATMYDGRTRIAKEVLKEIERHFEGSMFRTVINSNVRLREAVGFGKSIVDYAPKSKGYTDYMALAKEVLVEERIPGIGQSVREREQMFQPHKVKAKFSIYAPEASCVKIVGDFNNWTQSEDSFMRRNEDGSWSKEILLSPDVYQYKFVVDDMWFIDKKNPNIVETPFGVKNSVIELN
jgi:chromosome partitioning protein